MALRSVLEHLHDPMAALLDSPQHIGAVPPALPQHGGAPLGPLQHLLARTESQGINRARGHTGRQLPIGHQVGALVAQTHRAMLSRAVGRAHGAHHGTQAATHAAIRHRAQQPGPFHDLKGAGGAHLTAGGLGAANAPAAGRLPHQAARS